MYACGVALYPAGSARCYKRGVPGAARLVLGISPAVVLLALLPVCCGLRRGLRLRLRLRPPPPAPFPLSPPPPPPPPPFLPPPAPAPPPSLSSGRPAALWGICLLFRDRVSLCSFGACPGTTY
ncbi:anthrax toxin receptor-like [Cricetulus griseus]|uniref:Anthrax toxin receptor-like n=1 Tax=Cricetulus griseus TaxID=10029 RepID=A0A9J7H8P5_CRIGR|nr:anthrax toxin receptor-like [Cricetulus griseus]